MAGLSSRSLTPDDFDEGDALRRMSAALGVKPKAGGRAPATKKKAPASPLAILKQIGAVLVANAQKRFKDQSFDNKTPWQERQTPNAMGVISDLLRGKDPPDRRLQGRPALIDTGQTRNSIDFRILGPNELEYGSNLPHAGVLHAGGQTKSLPVTKEVKDGLAKLIKKNPDYGPLKFLFNKEEHSVNVPARPFVGISAQDGDDIRSIVQRALGVKNVKITRRGGSIRVTT